MKFLGRDPESTGSNTWKGDNWEICVSRRLGGTYPGYRLEANIYGLRISEHFLDHHHDEGALPGYCLTWLENALRTWHRGFSELLAATPANTVAPACAPAPTQQEKKGWFW